MTKLRRVEGTARALGPMPGALSGGEQDPTGETGESAEEAAGNIGESFENAGD